MLKKISLVPFFRQVKMMTNYEIFNLLYSEFQGKLEGDEIVFTQYHVAGNQYIHLHFLKDENKIDVI